MVEELRRYETGAYGGGPGRWEQVAKLRPDVAATNVMAPNETFERALVLRRRDGSRVELFHPGFGHTRGDAVAWLPRERVLFTGDLVINGPFNIVRDAEMAPWLDTLRKLRALEPLIVCPGHGACGDVSLIREQLAFFATLNREVSKRLKAGLQVGSILADIDQIREVLLSDDTTAGHVIPAKSELSVLSLRAQIERICEQAQT
jgi:glyoxylase-like metal-dependent hydrolase (beta-lactamase superfamily II)